MILERKITDLPEKHSVVQIHTGKGMFLIKLMIRDFILRSLCHSKEESMPERLLYFFKMFVLFSQQYQTTNRMKKFPSIGIFRNQN